MQVSRFVSFRNLAFGGTVAFAALILPFQPHSVAEPPMSPSPTKGNDEFGEIVKPLLTQFCSTCHNDKKRSAGLSFESYKDLATALKNPDVWELVREQLETKQMPPKGKPQPSDAQRKSIVSWCSSAAVRQDCGAARDPGRPTVRRLNRVEYNNTIRDLVGVDFKPADDFPSDDVGYGFDNIGDVLSMPPILLEKYLSAADAVLDAALSPAKPPVVSKEKFGPQNVLLRSTLGPLAKKDGRIELTSNGAAYIEFDFLHAGEYVLRAKAYGERAGDELPKLSIDLDRKPIKVHDVDAVPKKSKFYEARVTVTPGRHDVAFAFTNDFVDKEKKLDRNLYIDEVQIEGPFNPPPKGLPDSYKRILFAAPTGQDDAAATAQKILAQFATRGYRRPVTPEEIARLMKVFHFAEGQKESFEKAVALALKAVLVSPHFLFRIERDAEPNNPAAVHEVGDYELATRLSYFLWSSMPDNELFGLASRGELRKPAIIEAQVRRMLGDPKANALVENFAGQWLMLRSVATALPDRGTYPSFKSELRTAMVRETELFFDHVMRDNRSVLEFLDSDYTFLNDRLAKHYGIAGVSGPEFRKVTLTDKNRGGIITHASVLTVTSNPTRTSPVKRGKWILENILGTPPSPPPPEVPELPADAKAALTGSLRERMEQHRANPSCATCHAKMDPLGFGLENFDGVGAFRTFDGNFNIDPRGELPDGAKFSGPADLRKVLLAKADLFRRNLAEKMLTYAIGRGMEHYDKCAVADIVAALKKGDDRFAALIVGVVQSDPFLKRRGGLGTKP